MPDAIYFPYDVEVKYVEFRQFAGGHNYVQQAAVCSPLLRDPDPVRREDQCVSGPGGAADAHR